MRKCRCRKYCVHDHTPVEAALVPMANQNDIVKPSESSQAQGGEWNQWKS